MWVMVVAGDGSHLLHFLFLFLPVNLDFISQPSILFSANFEKTAVKSRRYNSPCRISVAMGYAMLMLLKDEDDARSTRFS
jgi:hypothetical protein